MQVATRRTQASALPSTMVTTHIAIGAWITEQDWQLILRVLGCDVALNHISPYFCVRGGVIMIIRRLAVHTRNRV